METFLMWVCGGLGAVVIVLLGIVAYFARVAHGGLEDAIRDLTITIRREIGNVHKRVDRLEKDHAGLRGEHNVITGNGTRSAGYCMEKVSQ